MKEQVLVINGRGIKHGPHRMNPNSMAAYIKVASNGAFLTIRSKILDFLSKIPDTSFNSRELSKLLHVERGSITGPLGELRDGTKIAVEVKPCATTGLNVEHYYFTQKKEGPKTLQLQFDDRFLNDQSKDSD